MKNTYLLAACLSLAAPFGARAQAIKLPFTLDRWDTVTVKKFAMETYMGRESIFLNAGAIITAKNVDFTDGIIEVDVNFPDIRNFPGVIFRLQADIRNCEMFYIGTQKAGKDDATRYSPLFNLQQAWQLYYGEGYSKPASFKFNTWHHIKIDVHGYKAELYIDDMSTPVLKVTELKREWKSGKIGLIADEAAIHYANFQYTPRHLPAPEPTKIPANGTGGLITRWQMSNVVNNGLFEKKYQLTPDVKASLTWTTQSTDSIGTVNFSKYHSVSRTDNTMVAKLTIDSQSDQMKALSFGFSDYVSVYLNNAIIYHGSDIYGSRDYQFIGTIGYFDTLYLPLKKGENELWFVVSEYFGGWGMRAKFENMEKISLK